MNLIEQIDKKLESFINSTYAKKLLAVVAPKMARYHLAPFFLYALYDGFIEETKDSVTVVIEANLTSWIDPELIDDENTYYRALEQGTFLSIMVDITVPKNIKTMTQEDFNKQVYSMVYKLLKPRLNDMDELLKDYGQIPERKYIIPLARKSYLRVQAAR